MSWKSFWYSLLIKNTSYHIKDAALELYNEYYPINEISTLRNLYSFVRSNIINENKFNKKERQKVDDQTTNALQDNNWSYKNYKRVSRKNVTTKITINDLNIHVSRQHNYI